jgi:hypothetical protein
MATKRKVRMKREPQGVLAVRPTIVEALENPRLLGGLPEFRDLTSWRRWMTILKAVYGLALDPEEHRWLQAHTGRETFDPAGYWTLLVSVGRQAGKSTIIAAVADYEAVFASPDLGGDHVVVVAQDFRAAVRGLYEKIAAPFERVPAFEPLVENPRADNMDLTTGVHIAAFPCRPAAVRGPSSRLSLWDEAAWARNTEGISQDREMMRALEPGLAMGGPMIDGRRRPGRLVLLSSPAGESGTFFDTFTRHWGRNDSPVLVVQAAAVEMNSLLPPDYLEQMRQDDPDGYAAEALGQFRGGLQALLDPVAVRAAVQANRTDFPPREGVAYVAHIDASSGRNDHYAVAIAHRDGDEIVVDVVRVWKAGPHFSTRRTAKDIAELMGRYGITEVTGDGYALGFVQDDFKAEGIEFHQIEKPGTKPDTLVAVNTSELMLDLINPMHSGLVRLPDSAELVAELIALERRRSTVVGVHDRVVVPPGRHKDQATAVSGVVYRLRVAPKRRKTFEGYVYDAATRSARPAAMVVTKAPRQVPDVPPEHKECEVCGDVLPYSAFNLMSPKVTWTALDLEPRCRACSTAEVPA